MSWISSSFKAWINDQLSPYNLKINHVTLTIPHFFRAFPLPVFWCFLNAVSGIHIFKGDAASVSVFLTLSQYRNVLLNSLKNSQRHPPVKKGGTKHQRKKQYWSFSLVQTIFHVLVTIYAFVKKCFFCTISRRSILGNLWRHKCRHNHWSIVGIS